MIDAKEYLFFGQNCILDDLTYSHNTGCKMRITLEDPDEVTPFKSMTKRRKNKAGQILQIAMRKTGEKKFTMVEAWFAGWTVNHSKGATIAVTIEPETFDQLRVLDEKQALDVVVYEIEEDGTSHNEEVRSAVEAKLKGGPMSVQAGKACNEISFHRYLERRVGGEIRDSKDAANAVRTSCGVTTRAKLDHDENARVAWRQLYRGYLAEIA